MRINLKIVQPKKKEKSLKPNQDPYGYYSNRELAGKPKKEPKTQEKTPSKAKKSKQ